MHCKFLRINGDEDKTYTYETKRTIAELKASLSDVDEQLAREKAEQEKKRKSGGGDGDDTLEAIVKERSKPYRHILDGRTAREEAMKKACCLADACSYQQPTNKPPARNAWHRAASKHQRSRLRADCQPTNQPATETAVQAV